MHYGSNVWHGSAGITKGWKPGFDSGQEILYSTASQTRSAAHSTSYPMGTDDYFPRDKVGGAWSFTFTLLGGTEWLTPDILTPYTECGISQLTFHADNESKNEAKAQIVTCQ
jgi:hypothetical protein